MFSTCALTHSLMHSVLRAWQNRDLGDPLSVEMHVEDLLNHLLTNFTDPVAPGEMALYAKHGAWTVPHFEAVPARIVPLMVMRTVLSDERVRFDHTHVPSWSLFVERYREALRSPGPR